MKYDFTSVIDRHGHDSLAVDCLDWVTHGTVIPKEGFDPLPMWVADMSFATCPAVVEAMKSRLDHPIFGYFPASEDYYNAIIRWQQTRHGVQGLESKHIGYENGVLGGVISALNCVCSRGDKVLIHAPTYIGFTHSLEDNGYHIVHSYLVQDENGIWRMDYEDMERRLREEKIHAAIFCSPHNPCGRVWERWELEKAMELFRKCDVYVVSDEIWSDLVLEGHKHIPTQSVSEDAKMRTAAMYAPSKTFNLAGLVGSYHIIYNDWWRDRVEKESALCHYNSMNVLSMHALVGAYRQESAQWVDELQQVLTQNCRYACDFIRAHFPGVSLQMPQGTYMLFLDCTGYCSRTGESLDALLQKAWEHGVMVQDGRPFHGKCAIRMNLALPYTQVQEAMDRLAAYVFNS